MRLRSIATRAAADDALCVLADEIIDLWTKMTIADQVHDEKVKHRMDFSSALGLAFPFRVSKFIAKGHSSILVHMQTGCGECGHSEASG